MTETPMYCDAKEYAMLTARRVGRWYLVGSPEYLETDPVLEDGSGPTTDERDYIYVCAKSAKRALVLAIRAFRRRYGKAWNRPSYLFDNPFAGATVDRILPVLNETSETPDV